MLQTLFSLITLLFQQFFFARFDFEFHFFFPGNSVHCKRFFAVESLHHHEFFFFFFRRLVARNKRFFVIPRGSGSAGFGRFTQIRGIRGFRGGIQIRKSRSIRLFNRGTENRGTHRLGRFRHSALHRDRRNRGNRGNGVDGMNEFGGTQRIREIQRGKRVDRLGRIR